MLLQNMDETLDIKPTVTIEGKALDLLKIESASVGETYQLSAMASITVIHQNKSEDGTDNNSITFELSNIQLAPEQKDPLAGFYPNSPTPVA